MNIQLFVEEYPQDPDLYIPFSLVTRDNKSFTATCVADSEKVISEYLCAFEKDLFSNEAKSFLVEKLNAIFNPMGYFLPQNSIESDQVYKLCTKPQLSNANVIKFEPKYADYPNETDIDLHDAIVANQKAFLVLDGDKIVSVACENFTENGETEIACETLPQYRRTGLAYATCAALCCEVIDRGETVLWRCNDQNVESIKLAEKLGFIEDGRELYACYYLGEEE